MFQHRNGFIQMRGVAQRRGRAQVDPEFRKMPFVMPKPFHRMNHELSISGLISREFRGPEKRDLCAIVSAKLGIFLRVSGKQYSIDSLRYPCSHDAVG